MNYRHVKNSLLRIFKICKIFPNMAHKNNSYMVPQTIRIYKLELPNARQSPAFSPPSYAMALVACVQRTSCTSCRTLTPSAECHRNSILRIKPKNWLPRQRPLRDQKTNFSLITHSLISTNLANLAKIGPVNVELIGLTGVVTNI